MDRAYYEEIAGPLYGLLIRLDDRLSGKDVALIAEVIEANELGLPQNSWPTYSASTCSHCRQTSRPTCSPLADRMQARDRIPRALEFCPAR